MPTSGGIAGAIGTEVLNGGYPEAYVIGDDNAIWRAYWNGSSFVWEKVGTPSNTVGITKAAWLLNPSTIPANVATYLERS
jgi:hypothetical protein